LCADDDGNAITSLTFSAGDSQQPGAGYNTYIDGERIDRDADQETFDFRTLKPSIVLTGDEENIFVYAVGDGNDEWDDQMSNVSWELHIAYIDYTATP